MAINNISGTSTPGIRGSGPGERTATETGRARNGGPQDSAAQGGGEVRLTSGSLRLLELESTLGREPAFDAERVEALRTAIEGGRYRPDPLSIARQLLDIEHELFE